MDTDAKVKDLIMATCRSPSERSLMFAMWGEISVLRATVHKLEEQAKKPNQPTVTKPPAKKSTTKKEPAE